MKKKTIGIVVVLLAVAAAAVWAFGPRGQSRSMESCFFRNFSVSLSRFAKGKRLNMKSWIKAARISQSR